MKLAIYFASLLALSLANSLQFAIGEEWNFEEFVIDKTKVEGVLTLTPPLSDKLLYSFTEHYDKSKGRSVTLIGLKANEFQTYHYVDELNGLLAGTSAGQCHLTEVTDELAFVPEINSFTYLIKQNSTDLNFGQLLRSASCKFATGPLGLVLSMLQFAKEQGAAISTDKGQKRRNIECDVQSTRLEICKDCDFVELKVYTSQAPTAGNERGRIVAFAISGLSKSAGSLKTFSIEIDVTYLKTDAEIVDEIRRESVFNLPATAGCSRYFKSSDYFEHIANDEAKDQTQMSLVFTQTSMTSKFMLAIDSASGYLRREILGESVSVWDTQKDLLYYSQPDVDKRKFEQPSNTMKLSINRCSVLCLRDEKLPTFFKPIDSSKEYASEALRPLSFLFGYSNERSASGEFNFARIGVGYVKGMPCQIYELTTSKMPLMFSLNEEPHAVKITENVEYITTFYLIEHKPSTSGHGKDKTPTWWPARMTLHLHGGKNKPTWPIDEIEISDFSWSLLGWQERPAQLFSLDECLESSDYDRRGVELLLEIVGDDGKEENNEIPIEVLARAKFSLEQAILSKISSLIGVSAMHFYDLSVDFRGRRHLEASFELVNRDADFKLTYEGSGKVERVDEDGSFAIVVDAGVEGFCTLASSLASQATFSEFCPTKATTVPCSVFAASTKASFVKNSDDACNVYKFSEDNKDGQDHHDHKHDGQSAVSAIIKNKDKLFKQVIEFQSGDKTLKVKVVDFQIETPVRLTKEVNYAYVAQSDLNEVKFITRLVDKFSTCASLCNLDVNCESYSYCSSSTEPECALTKIDIGKQDSYKIVDSQGSPKLVVTNELSKETKEYDLRKDKKCSLNERNYLTLYRQTNEHFKLKDSIIENKNFNRLSPFDCARLGAFVEREDKTRHIAMFATCPRTSACILDESIIVNALADKSQTDDKDQSEECFVHRKKLQTYFHPSEKVIMQSSKSKNKQSIISSATIEECATECWIKRGKNCGSFDYCDSKISSGNQCMLNSMNMEDALISGSTAELMIDCYHYERDFELDKLQRELDIGQQELYNQINHDEAKSSSKIKRLVFRAILTILTPIGFIVGLMMGQFLANKLYGLQPPTTRRGIKTTSIISDSPSSGLSVSDGGEPSNNRISPDDVIEKYNIAEDIQMSSIKVLNGKKQRKDSLKQELLEDCYV